MGDTGLGPVPGAPGLLVRQACRSKTGPGAIEKVVFRVNLGNPFDLTVVLRWRTVGATLVLRVG